MASRAMSTRKDRLMSTELPCGRVVSSTVGLRALSSNIARHVSLCWICRAAHAINVGTGQMPRKLVRVRSILSFKSIPAIVATAEIEEVNLK